MKVAKRFRWEGVHRLPWHTGGCQNLHGHSYQMWVVLKEVADERGMFIDFKEIQEVLSPLIALWDHAVLVNQTDDKLLEAIALLNSKHYILPYDTTSENLCRYVIHYLATHALDLLVQHQVSAISVKLQETETCFAEHTVSVPDLQALKKAAVLTEVN